MKHYRIVPLSLLLCCFGWFCGCATFSQSDYAELQGEQQCEDGQCEKPPRRWSEEWYEQRTDLPATARQKYKHGKTWPPYPRPVGEHATAMHLYHAAHYWPHPYNCQDIAYIRQVQETQISNGWINATTLYDYHFDLETQQLNQSGLLRLRWILEEAPEHRRVIFTQTAFTKDISNARLHNVRMAAVAMVGDYNVPAIMLRVTRAVGRPAVESDSIRRKYLETMPDPRITYEVESATDTDE